LATGFCLEEGFALAGDFVLTAGFPPMSERMKRRIGIREVES
jgi:hypothetical protein